MNFLVTGGAGMVGSRLCERLIAEGHRVLAVDDLSLGTRSRLEAIEKHASFRFLEADVSRPGWHAPLSGQSFDVVFHLAANSDISLGRRDPVKDLDKTFSTTIHTLIAAKDLKVPDLIFASSSAVYGADPVLPTPEDASRLHPVSIYGAGKLSSEAVISAFVENFGLRAWIYRFGNVVGQRLTHGVIYDFYFKLKKTPDRLEVLGNGHQTKTYIHVEDCIDGMLAGWRGSKPGAQAPHRARFQVFNLSSDGQTSVRAIAEECVRVFASGQTEIAYGEESVGWVGDVPKTHLDTRAIAALGWKPRYGSTESVQTATREFAEWIRTHGG